MFETGGKHIIELRNLSIGHQKGEALLKEINLSVHPGEMVALIGRNGTGKSTLLKSMLGLIPLIQGACYMDGAHLDTYDLRDRARKVSFVSSHLSQLPSISVRELVSLGRLPFTGFMGRLTTHDQEFIDKSLKEVGLNSFAERKLDHLSDGERQRTMIARALAQDTPLMVLDEPTAFLDIPNKNELIQLLGGFRDGGKSVIYSTHDLDTAMHYADKMWVIHQGKIIEGAPEDLGISGLFDSLFKKSGIRYDLASRRFKYDTLPKGSIRLEGEKGIQYEWTRTAMERLGYEVDDSGTTLIKLDNPEGVKRWTLCQSKQIKAFDNLYNLARFLNNDV
jgi:iron complex transport system ATP-binding protein